MSSSASVRFPRLFDSSGSSALPSSVGTFDGLLFESDFAPQFANRGSASSQYLLNPVKPLSKQGPRWRTWDRPVGATSFQTAKQRQMDEINYFEAVYLDQGISREILLPILEEQHSLDDELYHYDPSRKNVLDIYKDGLHAGREWLLMPGGLAGNEIYAYSFDLNGTMRAQQKPSFSFNTPILQITSSAAQLEPYSSNLVAVRTFNSVSFLSGNVDNASTLIFHDIHSSLIHSEPVDVAFNPTIPCEAAWICADRSLHVWDLRASSDIPHNRTRVIHNGDWTETSTSSATSRNNSFKWKGVQYAWHPRILLVGEAQSVSVFDLRSPSELLLPFYTTFPHTNLLRGMAYNPENNFEIGVCGTERTSLIDTRYPKRPLMEWEVSDPNDPPVGIQFLKAGNESALLTWNCRHGDIILHPYTPNPSIPNPFHTFFETAPQHPPQSNYKAQRLPPFHQHDPLYSDPQSDPTFSLPTRRIDLYHPEESSWGFVSEVNPHPLIKSKRTGGFGGSASSSGDRLLDEGDVRRLRENTRRKRDSRVPPWPGLVGVAVKSCATGVDIFQISAEGCLYSQRFQVAGSGTGESNDETQMAKISRRERNWISAVEKRALDDYDSMPFLRQNLKEYDLTVYMKYFSKILLNPIPAESPLLDNDKFIESTSSIVLQRQCKTLFEVYEATRKKVPVQYITDGRPVLIHPRCKTLLTNMEAVNSLVKSCNPETISQSSSASNADYMDLDTQPLDLVSSQETEDSNSGSIKLRRIPLSFLNMFEATNNVPSLESVRSLLEDEFSKTEFYPNVPSNLTGVPGDGQYGVSKIAIYKELERFSDLSRASALDWMASDVLLGSTVVEGDHKTTTTESVKVQASVEPVTEEDEYEDIDETIKALLQDADLNLPATATIHNSMMLKKSFALSKESILLRDKWDNPSNWYDDDYDAKRRMNSQSVLHTWSKRENALKTDEVVEEEEAAERVHHKRKSGRAAVTQEELFRAAEMESQMGSQIRVISASQRTTQSVPMAATQSQIQSQRFFPPSQMESPLRFASSPAIKREPGQSSQPPTQSLFRQSQMGSSLGSKFGASQGSSSQPMKKKPRKSGF
ncbi:hypothetical protein HDU79_009935 [Rhizoclosmatium sp. JEL0117]|nr:hypothetical protein HDU79_009935 [Rhizoclosmatium sp. JEL0117]